MKNSFASKLTTVQSLDIKHGEEKSYEKWKRGFFLTHKQVNGVCVWGGADIRKDYFPSCR